MITVKINRDSVRLNPDYKPRNIPSILSSLIAYSKYLWEYENTEITCDFCHETFNWRDLQTIDTEDCYDTEVCPKCGVYACCTFDIESICSVVQEMGLEDFNKN